MSEQARVLVVSDSCLSSAHGTGTLLLRHFSNYPPDKLANAYWQREGEPVFAKSQRFVPSAAENRLTVSRLYNSAVFRLGLKNWIVQQPLSFEMESGRDGLKDFLPEIIYSVVFSQAGLALADQICARFPAGIPVLQYFLDYQIASGFRSKLPLQRVLARAEEVWALTEEIAGAVGPFAADAGRTVRVQPGFHLPLPPVWKQRHRAPADGDFTCAISGNFWRPEMARLVKRVWHRVQKQIPSVKPVQWFCHPESVERTRKVAGDVEPEIQPMGFFQGAELLEQLRDCDLAIVPFNAGHVPENDYARYSLPSRLTELLSLGLPVFCIAGAQTPLARYVNRHQVGKVCDGENEERLASQLAEFISNQPERIAMGVAARAFAEKKFALEPFQDFFYGKLAKLAGQGKSRK